MTQLLRQPGSILFCGNAWGGLSPRGHCGREDTPAPAILLHDPLRLVTGDDPDALPAALDDIERELAAGHIVAGFMCYEAGRTFGLQTHDPSNLTPLYWFGVYDEDAVGGVTDPDLSRCGRERPRVTAPTMGVAAVPEMGLNVTRDEYCAAIARIKDYIAAGDTYQVNYTCHARFEAELDPLDYFLAMVRSHPVPYAAYLNLGEAQIISISPELLLEKRGPILKTKPMKGTRKRGRTLAEDAALREELTVSLKDRAENLMIVDMMRNDLGRICEVGSVETPLLFEAEKYHSVWQMTTTVTGRLATTRGAGHPGPPVSLAEIIAATLPGSSVTGAPKQHTMEIIHELEREPRGVYCGAIGLLRPDGDFTFNLPIRTLVHRDGHYDLGIGAGIVWDSDPLDEYEETLLKSQFARRLTPDLRLFETLLIHADGSVAYEAEHLQRLQQSAHYWDYPFDAAAAREALRESAAALASPSIIRMELDQDGGPHFTTRPIPAPPAEPVRVLISPERTHSADRFLYHKTNQRALYDTAREQAMPEGFFEVLFCNEVGNLTEGAISNLFVRVGEGWLTPPLMDGLLPGIWRENFMAQNGAVEEHVTPELLAEAEEVVIGNSVRGTIRVDEVVLEGRTIYCR
jgi:para-aminobenzoate synthetase/4-amino-4-deoxychorismate lyase